MSAFYNEHDPYAAQWLRNLVAAGRIAPGVVDERDIRDIHPDEFAGFTQCHFFAGIGVWSYALRRAGWPDDRTVWTGSCPCQPFSGTGKGGGFADERHLWPAFDWLIEQCRPDIVLGEQVEGPAGRAWLDLVSTDLEGAGYAFGAAVFPAAGVGAPHIRRRTYWMAHAMRSGWPEWRPRAGSRQASGRGGVDGLAFSDRGQRDRIADGEEREPDRQEAGRNEGDGRLADDRESGGLANADGGDASPEGLQRGGEHRVEPPHRGAGRRGDRGPQAQSSGPVERSGPVNGFWRDADWLGCRDGKWRPVEPGSFPLAHGASARVGRLRAYGNAIVAQQAQAFIEACLEIA